MADKPEETPVQPTVMIRPRMKLPTQKAINKLSTGKPGDLFTRQQMADAIEVPLNYPAGQPYLWRGEAYVRSAVEYVERELKICWQWIREKQAWEFQDDAGKTTAASSRLRSTIRKGRRAFRVGLMVNEANLTTDKRRELHCTMAVAGIMVVASSSQAKRVVNEQISEGKKLLKPDVDAVMKLFKQ